MIPLHLHLGTQGWLAGPAVTRQINGSDSALPVAGARPSDRAGLAAPGCRRTCGTPGRSIGFSSVMGQLEISDHIVHGRDWYVGARRSSGAPDENSQRATVSAVARHTVAFGMGKGGPRRTPPTVARPAGQPAAAGAPRSMLICGPAAGSRPTHSVV